MQPARGSGRDLEMLDMRAGKWRNALECLMLVLFPKSAQFACSHRVKKVLEKEKLCWTNPVERELDQGVEVNDFNPFAFVFSVVKNIVYRQCSAF